MSCVQRASYFVLCVLFYIFVYFYRKAEPVLIGEGYSNVQKTLPMLISRSLYADNLDVCWTKLKIYKIQYIDQNAISKLKPLKHLIMNFAGTLNKWYQRTYWYQWPNKALWPTRTGNKYISKWSKSLYILPVYQLGFWCDDCYRPLCSDSKSINVQSFDHLHVI